MLDQWIQNILDHDFNMLFAVWNDYVELIATVDDEKHTLIYWVMN